MTYRYFIIILLISFFTCQQEKKFKYYSVFTNDESRLCEGDLVFRKGIGTAARFVSTVDKNTKFSHVGILVKDTTGNWFVAHAVPGEQYETNGREILKKDSISIFFRSDRTLAGAVYRLPLEEEKRRQIAQEAIRLVEKEIFFDHNFNTDDSAKLYCTEYIHIIYNIVGEDITEGRRHTIPAFKYELIFPSDILKNEKMVEVYSFSDIK